MKIKEVIIKIAELLFSRWRFLSLYIIFAGIALNGWYIDIVGCFSSSEVYAASIKAQYGDINILNVLVFVIGSVVFLGYLWVDVMNKRLKKMITGNINIKSNSMFGDSSQAIATAENSQAISAPQGQITINNIAGITEERCNNIFDEKLPIALQDYSIESIVVAKERTYKFRQKLVPRLGEEKNGFEQFADPSFLLLLIEAQKASASTDREADYEVLSELLANRAKMGKDRSLHMGINKAVNMLPFLSDSQLVGMTIRFCIARISPTSDNIIQGLSTIDECYGKIIGEADLPIGENWLDSLEAGGLVKNVRQPLQSFKKSRQIIIETFDMYTITGIKKDSERYKQAVDILKEVDLPENSLIEHELNKDYVRLLVLNDAKIDNLQVNNVLEGGMVSSIPFDETQKSAFHKVMALYEGDQTLKADFENRLVAKVKAYPNLMRIMDWWDRNTTYFELTIVGRILANANANKCDARIPIVVK